MTAFKYYNLIISFLFIGLSSCSNSKKDCSVLKNCKLQFTEIVDRTAYIEIKNNKSVEYKNNKKYFIKSDLVWLSDCEYNATMTEINYPNFPFGVGTVMNVKIHKIENDIVYYTAEVKGQKIDGKFKLITG